MIPLITPLLTLLEKVQKANTLETYFYFPEIIAAGETNIERIDFEYLLFHHYIIEVKANTSGKQYVLTNKAELILNDAMFIANSDNKAFAVN